MNVETFSFDAFGVRHRVLHVPSETASRRRAPLLLVHGFAQSATTWLAVGELLSQERELFAIDLVGHGGSSVPASPGPFALGAQGESLLRFIDEMPRKPLVVGYSMGGRVALSALLAAGPAAFARKSRGLVLESAGLGLATEADRTAAIERDAATVRRLRETSLDDFMTFWENLPLFDTQKQLPKKTRRLVRAGRLANDAEALARSVECAGQHRMPSRHEVERALRDLGDRGFPVLYLAGAKDAKYAALANGVHAAGLAQVRVVPKAGHNVHLEDPKAFAACIHGMP